MTGSTPFLIEEAENFKRSFKKLAKTHGADFVELVAEILGQYDYLRNQTCVDL